MKVEPVTLKGVHVVLEPLAPSHVDALWPAASERDIWTYMGYDIRAPDDLGRWVRERVAAAAAGTALAFVQRDARTGAAFGSTSLFDLDLVHRGGEIGHTWIGASHRRTAANTEAKFLLLRHAFEALRLGRVQLKTDARNARSRAAIARIGATFEGVLRNHRVLPDGAWRDSAYFSVVEAEWPRVKASLQARLGPAAPAAP